MSFFGHSVKLPSARLTHGKKVAVTANPTDRRGLPVSGYHTLGKDIFLKKIKIPGLSSVLSGTVGKVASLPSVLAWTLGKAIRFA